MKADLKPAQPIAKPVEMALCKSLYAAGPTQIPADIARACISGHDCRPLSSEYWSRTPNAMYKLIEPEAANA
jgi:hypothetical protein